MTTSPRLILIFANCADDDTVAPLATAVRQLDDCIEWIKQCSGQLKDAAGNILRHGLLTPVNAGVYGILKLPGLTSKYWTGAGNVLHPESERCPYSIFPLGDPNLPSYLQTDLAPLLPPGLQADYVCLVINLGGNWFAGYTGGPQFYRYFGCNALLLRGWGAVAGKLFHVGHYLHEFCHIFTDAAHCVGTTGPLPSNFNGAYPVQVSPREIMGAPGYAANGMPVQTNALPKKLDPVAMRRANWPDNAVSIPIPDGEYLARPEGDGFALYVALQVWRGDANVVRIEYPTPVLTDFVDTDRNIRIQWLNGQIVVTLNYTPPAPTPEPTPTPVPVPIPTPTTYKLTVNNGTGSGNYAADQVVAIKANAAPNPAKKYKFGGWTGYPVTSTMSTTTTLKMPAANATVTANWVRK